MKILLSILAVLLIASRPLWADQPPNIVLIMADDLGYGELGCYGQKWIKTPNIDALASEGMRFTQFYAGAPVCAPSRCVLMTGKHGGHAYIRDNREAPNVPEMIEKYGWEFSGQEPLPANEVTLAELLKERGYATAAIGKWGLGQVGTSGDPNLQGFDLFFGYNCQRHAHNHYPRFLRRNSAKVSYSGNDGKSLSGRTFSQDEFAKAALEFIRENKSNPFFLYLPFTIPHLAIQVPEASLEEYQGKIPEHAYEHKGYLKHPTPHAGYAAMVSHMDRDVGRIVDLIDDLGLGANTLILFTSDNGPTYARIGGADSTFFNSTAGLRGRKGSVYEGGIRVPLIARWTGTIEPNSTSHLISASWDVLPTACELAGATPPEAIDGVSLLATLTDKGKQREHDHLLWEFAGYGGQQAVRMGEWKGVRVNMRQGNRTIELYNLRDDPAESHNVADQHPSIVRRIEDLLETDRTESTVFPLVSKTK